MKKILGNPIVTFILGAIIFGSIGVSASILYQASEIGFTPKNSNWKVDNLEDALNDLYYKKNGPEYQKIVVNKAVNGYVYNLKIYDDNNQIIYKKDYNCDIYGGFSTTIQSTYEYKEVTYTLEVEGIGSTSSSNALIIKLFEGNEEILSYTATANGPNGSYVVNDTHETKKICN